MCFVVVLFPRRHISREYYADGIGDVDADVDVDVDDASWTKDNRQTRWASQLSHANPKLPGCLPSSQSQCRSRRLMGTKNF